jgi:hypothetical protein
MQILELRMSWSENRFPLFRDMQILELRMSWSENRFPLFRDMRYRAGSGVSAWPKMVVSSASIVFRRPPK